MAIPNLNTNTGIQKFSLIALLTVFICERDDWDTKAELVDMTTTPVWKNIGETKTGEATTLEVAATTVPITTVEKGNTPHGEIISDLTAKSTFTLAQVNDTVKQYMTNYYTTNGVENAIGQFTKEFSLRFHPTENGTDYTKDIIFPKCTIKVTAGKTGELGQYETLKCEVSGIFDEEVIAGKQVLVLTDLA